MDCGKGVLCFSRTRPVEKAWFSSFMENGSKLLEGLLAASDGEYGIPYRTFTARELIKATANFKNLVMYDGSGEFYRGSFGERELLVKRCFNRFDRWDSYITNDVVITLQMSHHKNVFKLLGCCLEFRTPALVYEYDSGDVLLSDILYSKKEGIFSKDTGTLSWSVRLKLAVGIANALVYLHSAFPTPIIHRDLCARNILICSDGVAKLLDFSLCIPLPPGESHVEDAVVGVTGYGEPEYITSGIITEKTDVYRFGWLLFELLAGQKYFDIVNLVEDHIVNNQIDKILDPILLAEKAGNQQEHVQQFKALAELAWRCNQPRELRPDMITVAKELAQIKEIC